MEDYKVHVYEQLLKLVQMRMEPRDDLLYGNTSPSKGTNN
jgi:hypothetical protein